MKRALLYILLCISLSAEAKKIEIGLNGGITYDREQHPEKGYISYHAAAKVYTT